MSTLCQPGVETCYNASVPATNRLSLHKLGAAHNVAFGCFAALGHPQAEFLPSPRSGSPTNRLSLHKLGAAHNVAYTGHPQAEFLPSPRSGSPMLSELRVRSAIKHGIPLRRDKGKG